MMPSDRKPWITPALRTLRVAGNTDQNHPPGAPDITTGTQDSFCPSGPNVGQICASS